MISTNVVYQFQYWLLEFALCQSFVFVFVMYLKLRSNEIITDVFRVYQADLFELYLALR